jgi:hypothetical protein
MRRRRHLPEVVDKVVVPAGERRVGWAVTADGAAVLATDRHLLLPGVEPLPWWEVAQVTWARPHLTVTRVAPVVGAGRSLGLELAEDDGGFPDIVRARVTASIAWTSRVQLPSSAWVRVVGRRCPDQEALAWQLVFDRSEDHADPVALAQAREALLGAQRTVG